MIVKKIFPIFYIIAAIAVIAGIFLPFAEYHYGYVVTTTNLWGTLLGKIIIGSAAVSILVMIIKYSRVLTFLCTAITDGCAIITWAQWREKLVDSAPLQAATAVYTRGYGYYIFLTGAILLLLFGILCFIFVDED